MINLAWHPPFRVVKKEMEKVSFPLGMLGEKPLSYLGALTKNCLQDPAQRQVPGKLRTVSSQLCGDSQILNQGQDHPQPLQREYGG